MKALIVAAGLSSRLYPLTQETPKALLEVGGEALIERTLDMLETVGIEDVVVVVGFRQEKLRGQLKDRVRYVCNPFYSQTNNMASMWVGIPHMESSDFLYLHGDVICHQKAVEDLIHQEYLSEISLLVDFDTVDEEAMKVRLKNGSFVESSKDIPLDEARGEWTGLARISSRGGEKLFLCIEQILCEGGYQEYDTVAFNRLAHSGMNIGLVPTQGLPWCEIDTVEDLERARNLFKA